MEKKNLSLIEYAESMPEMSYNEVKQVKVQSGIMANMKHLDQLNKTMIELRCELAEVKSILLSLVK